MQSPELSKITASNGVDLLTGLLVISYINTGTVFLMTMDIGRTHVNLTSGVAERIQPLVKHQTDHMRKVLCLLDKL